MYENNNEFIITRIFDAPRLLLWESWTKTEHLKNWWGSKDFKVGIPRLELRPGGVFHYNMQSPDGHISWGKSVYREIVPPEKLVFINSFSDETGAIIRHPISPTWPLEVLNTLIFSEVKGQTTLIFRGGPIHASELEHKTYHQLEATLRQGLSGTFDQLEEYLDEI